MKFGGHEWQTLETQDSRVLILSQCVLEKMPYHDSGGTTWENCDLRRYLNNEFYNSFAEKDRERILDTRNSNSSNPWYGTNSGNETIDKIFLLSLEEVVKYFGDSGQLNNRLPNGKSYIEDQYNSAREASDRKGISSHWWLRSPGHSSDYAAYISDGGLVYVIGNLGSNGGLRPALWLNL